MGLRQGAIKVLRVAALLAGLAVLSIVGLGLWHQRLQLLDALVSTQVVSDVARAWNCRGVARPTLATSQAPWEIAYGWSGGRGPGAMRVRIRSDGHAVMTRQAVGSSLASVMDSTIPADKIAAIASAVDDSGLLCLTTRPRAGYRVFDMGRYSVAVTQGSYAKTVYVDECHTVANPYDFERVIRSIQVLKPLLGPAIAWGPYATTSVTGACVDVPVPR